MVVSAKKNGTTRKSHLPEGFRSAKADRAEYFYKPKADTLIRGLLMGRFPKRGKFPGWYYQVKVFEPVEADYKVVLEDGENQYESREAPAGSLVNIDEKGGLACLAEEADGSKEVFIWCHGKRSIQNGQTAWDFEVGLKPIDPNAVPF